MNLNTLQADICISQWRRGNHRIRNAILLAIGLLLIVFASPAKAYTVHHCSENWYPMTRNGQNIDSPSQGRVEPCKRRPVKKLNERYGVINGKGYFMTESHEQHDSCSHGGPLPDLACFIPSALRPHDDYETRDYYELTQSGSALRVLADLYATDGREVFYAADVIPGADPATFRLFVPKGGKAGDRWAHDQKHVYSEERIVPMMVPGVVEVIGDTFAINGGRVFTLDPISGPSYRPDIKARLTLLSAPAPLQPAITSDGERIYLGTKSLDGVRAATFQMLVPVCPVPGKPDLKCVGYAQPDNFRVARSGPDVLYFHTYDDVKRIAAVPDFVYFLPYGSSYLGIGGNKIFNLDPLHQNYGGRAIDGVSFVGRVSGPAAGYLADDRGFIRGLSWGSGPLCGEVARLADPTPERAHQFGPLRRIPADKLPPGYATGYENNRYRYLFNDAAYSTSDDTVVDLGNGKPMRANWCGDDIQFQGPITGSKSSTGQ